MIVKDLIDNLSKASPESVVSIVLPPTSLYGAVTYMDITTVYENFVGVNIMTKERMGTND